MDEVEFDKFAQEYNSVLADSISSSGEGPGYFAEYKIADIAREYAQIEKSIHARPKILDFGAGIGGSVPYVCKYFPNAQLTCLDVSRRSLEIAENRFPSKAQFVHFDGGHIPFADNYFDIAYAACVFHHIDHKEHVSLLKDIRRVLRPGGVLFVFEHNPFNPLTLRVVNNCVFDENAHLIRGFDMRHRLQAAGFASVVNKYRIFFPHFLRALRPVESAIAWLPLGGQYYSFAKK